MEKGLWHDHAPWGSLACKCMYPLGTEGRREGGKEGRNEEGKKEVGRGINLVSHVPENTQVLRSSSSAPQLQLAGESCGKGGPRVMPGALKAAQQGKVHREEDGGLSSRDAGVSRTARGSTRGAPGG